MTQPTDARLLIEISHMYYDEDMTQQQIANKMNMSRSLVSKLLNKAKKAGIVEVIVHSELTHPYKEVEDKLKQAFGLKYVKIVDSYQAQAKDAISMEASRYLGMRLSSCKYIAVAASRAVRDIAKYFTTSMTFPNVTFVPMSGGLGEVRSNVDTNNICLTFAQKSGARNMLLHTPVIVDSPEAKDIILDQYFVKHVLDKARKADMAVVGIGSAFQWFELEEAYLKGVKTDFIPNSDEVCGDIGYNYFDKNGDLLDCKWNDQLMGLSLNEIKQIPEVLCVASEIDKAESIFIAAKNDLITSLITNIDVAKRVLLYYSKDLFHSVSK